MLTRNLDLTIPPVDPTQYLGQIRSTVEANYVYEKEAAAAIEAATHEALTGHSPTVIAAAALYAAGIVIPSLEILPQGELATAAGCSQSSIRNNYLTLVAAHPSVSASPADLRAPDETRYRPHTLSSKLGNL
jgi:transcription initiation factor TFIIIB Brf1 subunit/transcription initiation factor TFIIB